MQVSQHVRQRSIRQALRHALLALTLAGMSSVALAAGEAAAREELAIQLHEANKPLTGDLDVMLERRSIRVLTAMSKTNYFVNKGQQRGVTYDVFRLLEEDLNKQLAKTRKGAQKHLKVSVVFVPVATDELLTALNEGKGDIAAANLTITPERLRRVDFTAPTYADVSELVISGPASPALSDLDGLSGQEVYVRKSASYYASLLALNKQLAGKGKAPVKIKAAPETLADEDLIEMVNAGLIPFTVVDKHLADFWTQVFPKVVVHQELAVRRGGNIAWAIRKNSPRLQAMLNDFISRNGAESKQRNMLLQRYLKSAKYVKDAASESERRKFLALVKYFQKYADKYDVDWLLMAAQGYQESQLNQAARSPVGAIGVMQVMPATGKDLNVGDIAQTEANIHAGIKYMRWMIDNYYAKEPMSNLDKALFSFASYNAGAGRVSQLRKEAAKRGLNPNVWFHNVEYVAAEKIGAETVTYVANIYKYYIAYKLVMEAREEKEHAAEEIREQLK